MMASWIGVKAVPNVIKILSLLISLLIACTARVTLNWLSSTMYLILRPCTPPLVLASSNTMRMAAVLFTPPVHRAGQVSYGANYDLGIRDAQNHLGRCAGRVTNQNGNYKRQGQDMQTAHGPATTVCHGTPSQIFSALTVAQWTVPANRC